MGKADDVQKRPHVPRKEFLDKARTKFNKWDVKMYELINKIRTKTPQDLANLYVLRSLMPADYQGGCYCDRAQFWFDSNLLTSTIK